MAWEVEKDVLYPGRVVVAGPDGRPRSYTFTADDLARIERTGNAKIAERWEIPLAWEHQPVEPTKGRAAEVRLSQAERDRDFARGVFGFAKGLVQRDGRLRVRLAGDDEADLKQFQKVRYVSPEIAWDWTDSDGKTWHGPTITHIAATPRPVQRHQDAVGQPIRLSLAAMIRECAPAHRTRSASAIPVAPRLRLSLNHYEGRAVADDLDLETPADTDTDTGGKKNSAWARIAEALAGCGVKIGDGSNIKDADHLADLIEVACMNGEDEPDMDEELPPENEEQQGDMDAPPPGATEPPQPIQMSQQAAKALKVQQDEAAGYARANLKARIARLERTGRVTPAKARELIAEADKIQLSFTAAGKVADSPLLTRIEAREELAAGSAAPVPGRRGRLKLSQRSNAKPATPSKYQEDGELDVDAVVSAFEKTGRR